MITVKAQQWVVFVYINNIVTVVTVDVTIQVLAGRADMLHALQLRLQLVTAVDDHSCTVIELIP